jgi:hypothetical protein
MKKKKKKLRRMHGTGLGSASRFYTWMKTIVVPFCQ